MENFRNLLLMARELLFNHNDFVHRGKLLKFSSIFNLLKRNEHLQLVSIDYYMI
jgi:hypothetical protein